MDKAKEQQVGRNVVRANVRSRIDVDDIARIKRPGVDELEDENDDPILKSASNTKLRLDRKSVYLPVDGGNDAVLRKCRWAIVAPDGAARLVALAGRFEGVVDGRDEEDEVGHERADSVQDQRLRGELFAARERVYWWSVSPDVLKNGETAQIEALKASKSAGNAQRR